MMKAGSDLVRLVSSRPDVRRRPASRYRIVVSESSRSDCAIRVFDRDLGRVLARWDAETTHRLLESGTFARLVGDPENCDKNVIRKLILAAAAVQMSLQRAQLAGDRLHRRLAELEIEISACHACVAQSLFDHPGQHLSREDVVCLLGLRCLGFERRRIETCLDDLVAWRVVQRIDIDANTAFFDIDTNPHLHLYCPRRHELSDAPSSGVIRADRAHL